MEAQYEIGSPQRFFQESAKEFREMYSKANTKMAPLVQRYILGRTMSSSDMRQHGNLENRRAGLQADNLVWQQEMFVKILKLQGLFKEGLAYEEDLSQCRKDVLGVVIADHPHGEWVDFTRDKLLFLQDLLRAGCISEAEYHASKSPILTRLAEQGALIDSQDFVMLVSPPPPKGAVGHDAPDCRASLRIAAADAAAAEFREEYAQQSTRKTPIKQMLEAMARLKNNTPTWGSDLGPTREAPTPPSARRMMINKDVLMAALLGKGKLAKEGANEHEDLEDDEILTANYATSSTAQTTSPISPSPNIGAAQRRMTSLLSGLVRKFQGEPESGVETYLPFGTEGDTPPPQLKREELEPKSEESMIVHPPPRVLREAVNGQGPDTVKLKRKITASTPPTNFFIDKVLGDNIKAELNRIRTEIGESNAGQTFTNDQIDAIATRLPVDKVELQRFFPKTWCDKYGDMVIEVVQKEFKNHVGEMENQGRLNKQQRRVARAAREQAAAAAAAKLENDENVNSLNTPRTILVQNRKTGASPVKKSSNLNQCFTTGDSIPVEAKAKLPLIEESPDKGNCRAFGFEEQMDGKLTAEIQKMPSQRFNVILQ